MKQALLVLVLLLSAQLARATNFYTYNGGGTAGNWSTATTWTTDPSGSTSVGANVPAQNDAVFVLNGYTVSLTAAVATTGLQITIQQGGVLNMSTFALSGGLASLSGQGTLRLNSASFPSITNNNFDDAGTGTVEYDFAGSLPATVVQYNNLRIVNTSGVSRTITFGNTAAATVQGTLQVRRIGAGALAFNLTGVNISLVGDVTVGGGALFGLSGGAGRTVTSSGNITVEANSTLDFASAGTADISFVGATNRTFTNNGATRLNHITVNKGNGPQYVLAMVSAAAAPLTLNTANADDVVVLTNGTLKLGNNIVLSTLDAANGNNGYDIPATAGLWIDGGSVTLPEAVKGGLINQGVFRLSSGSFVSSRNDGAVIKGFGSYIIEGGTMTVEKFSTVKGGTPLGSFAMSGGTLNVEGTGQNLNNQASYARFSLPEATQIYNVSGGTINVYNTDKDQSGVEIASQEGNYSVTGGNFNIILSKTNDAYNNGVFKLSSAAPFWNLTITKLLTASRTADTEVSLEPTINIATANPLVVLNVLNLTGSNVPALRANGVDVTVQNHFTIGSTAIYKPGNNITRFTGGQNHIFTVDGTVSTGTDLGLYNMVVDKPSGSLSLAGAATTFPQVRNELRLESGVMDDGGKTLNVLGNIINSATHTSSGGTGSITLAGAGLQTLNGDGNGVFGNLTLSNTNATDGFVAAQLLAAQAVSGTLLFTKNHILDIGTHRLSITSTSKDALLSKASALPAAAAVPFSNVRLIRTAGNQSDGGLRKTYGAFSATNAEAFLYPVGTLVPTNTAGVSATIYTPATIGITAQPTRYGKITVAPVKVQNPFVTNTAVALKYFWKVTSADFVDLPANKVTHSYSAPKNTVAVALVNGNLAAYRPAFYTPTQWTRVGTAADVDESAATTFTINFRDVNADAEYTAGEDGAFGPITAFYSRTNGNWETPATWSTDGTLKHGGEASFTTPGPGNPVFVGDGNLSNHVVTVTQNNAFSGSLEIANGSTVDVGVRTGHNFGSLPNAKVQGAGRLRISSSTTTAVFPGGDFGTFLGPLGGTVEYYTQAAGPSFSIPAGATLGTYRNLETNVGNPLTITLPARSLRIYENLSNGTLATYTGVTNLSATATTLTIDANLRQVRGAMNFGSALTTLSVGRNVEVSAGASVIGNQLAAHTLEVGGSVINNGVFNMSGVAVTFVGTTDEAITGTTAGASTQFSTLRINKGTSQVPVLTLDVAGTLNVPTTDWLVGLNGTFRFAKPGTAITLNTGAAGYTVVNTAALQVDNATATLNATTNGPLYLAGRLHARAGILNVGTPGSTNDNDIEYSGATDPVITVGAAGTLNVTGQVRRPTTTTQGNLRYEQLGGTATIYGNGSAGSDRAQLEVLNPDSYFNMSGGTLNLRRTNGNVAIISDLYLQPASSEVTGGTIVLGEPTTAGAYNLAVDTTVPLFNLRVEAGATGVANTATLVQNPLTLRGSLTIGNNNSVFNANGLDVRVAGNFANNNTANPAGSLTAGGYRVGTATQTTTFDGTTNDQQISGAAGNQTTFANLVVNNTRPAGVVQLQANTALRVNSQLTLSAGNLNDNGQTITARGNIVNAARHSGAGRLLLDNTTTQTIGGNGAGRFGNVELTNTAGATLLAGQQIDGTLTFGGASGSLNIGSNLLRLTLPGENTVVNAGPARFIQTNGIVADAGIEKAFSNAGGLFIYPIGTGTKFTPGAVSMTNTGGAAGTITMRPINTAHPATTSPANTELTYYWQVSHTGFGATPTLSLFYQYLDVDLPSGASENALVVGRFQGSSWSIPATSGVDAALNRINVPNVNFIDGDYTAGLPAEFGAVKVYYSRTAAQVGGAANWDLADSWTFNSDGSTDAVVANRPTMAPTAANPVVILASHTINSNGQGRNAASLELRGTLNLSNHISNNFNAVTGTGRLVIASPVFPAGNYTAFTSVGGGTVEYAGNTDFSLTSRTTYNNLEFSGTAVRTLSNVNLNIQGKLLVAAGTVRNPSNVTLTLSSLNDDFTNRGQFELNDGSLQIARSLVNTGTLVLGQGTVQTGSTLTNNGILTAGAGQVTVGTTLLNTGTYNAASGQLQTAQDLSNTGTFNAGQGIINVGRSLLSSGNFQAGNGDITVTQDVTNQGVYTANSNLLTIGGNFNNQGTGSFNAGSGRIMLEGNLTNSSTNVNAFTASSSTVSFLSNSARTLGGTAVTTFNMVNKVGTGALTLGRDAIVTNVLSLASGTIVTGTNILRLTNTAEQPIVGESMTAYISGKLAISFPNDVNTSRVFPVGNSQFYRPVTIRQTAAGSVNPVVLVELINTRPTGTIGTGLSNISRERYYRVQTLSGTIAQPTVRLSFNTGGASDEEVNVPGNLRIARATSSAGPWSNAGGAGVFTPEAPSGNAVSAPTTIDGTTFFALASTNEVDNPLPVELTSFTAVAKGSAVQVAWTTASEKNSAYFEVQRAGADLSFQTIGRVEAQGTTSAQHSYQLLDNVPSAGLNYYRLKQVDQDGTASLSPVVTVRFDGVATQAGKPALLAYPNPAKGQGFQLLTSNLPTAGGLVQVLDSKGRIILTQTVTAGSAGATIQPTSPLAGGLYLVRWNTAAGQTLTTKVVVE